MEGGGSVVFKLSYNAPCLCNFESGGTSFAGLPLRNVDRPKANFMDNSHHFAFFSRLLFPSVVGQTGACPVYIKQSRQAGKLASSIKHLASSGRLARISPHHISSHSPTPKSDVRFSAVVALSSSAAPAAGRAPTAPVGQFQLRQWPGPIVNSLAMEPGLLRDCEGTM